MKQLTGIVTEGKQLGRTIGFPTANLTGIGEVELANGVYAVRVQLADKSFYGVMNVGTRPTFNDGSHRTVEVHILRFYADIYGQSLTVQPVAFIRQEQKFEGLQQLVEQLQRDVLTAKHILNSEMYVEQFV